MQRETGHYIMQSVAGEAYRAYLPDPLPPTPALEWTPALVSTLEKTNRALGRLDAVADLLPDTSLFLYQYVRKEALLSSQIEGTQSSLSDLLLLEIEEAPGTPLDDVEEVSNYIAALNHGLRRMSEGFPLSLRLIREMHAKLLEGARSSHKTPGEFRRSQNWVGGTRPGNARFVPPPPNRLMECLDDLEKYLHDDSDALPLLIKAALVHVQFETIHPFLDGNGRIGRLLITLMLCDAGALREPVLYLSLYFKTYREAYYEHLQQVRLQGDWEAWLQFFLEGVTQVSQQAVETSRELIGLFERDRDRIRDLGRIAGSILQVHEQLQRQPILTIPGLQERLQLSHTTLGRCVRKLQELGIVRELPGRKRNRLYTYDRYLAILSKGAEPL